MDDGIKKKDFSKIRSMKLYSISQSYFSQKVVVGIIIGLFVVTILIISFFISNIESIEILMLSVINLIISIVLMQKIANIFYIRRLSIVGFWYIFYILMVFIPAFFVFFEKTDNSRYIYLFGINSVLLTVPLGIVFSNKFFSFKTSKAIVYFTKPIHKSYSNSFFLTLIIIQIVTIIITTMYFYEAKNIPLLYAIRHPGDYANILNMRENSFKLLNSKFSYIYFLFRQFIYPILICLSLGVYLISRKIKALLMFFIMFSLGLFYATASLIKGPAVNIFIALSLFWLFYKGNEIKIFRFFVVSSSLMLLIPILILYLHAPGREFGSILSSIFIRIFKTPAEILYYYFEIFPKNMDYLYGRSIGKVSFIINIFDSNYEFINLPNYVFLYMSGGKTMFSTGLAPAPFIGDLNANFGIFGVILGGVIAGFVMQSIQIWIYSFKKKDILILTIHGMLIYSFWELNRTALTTVLLSYGGITIPLFFYIYKYLQNMVKAGNVSYS